MMRSSERSILYEKSNAKPIQIPLVLLDGQMLHSSERYELREEDLCEL